MFQILIPSKTRLLEKIERLGGLLSKRTDCELKDSSKELQFRAKSGEPLSALVPQAFALVREAAWRTLRLKHFEVQLLGGAHLAKGRVIEMETGQGKTLTATLPLYLYAIQGKGAHLATSNDYLAQRDAETMRPLYERLGLTCGYVIDQMPDPDRKRNYACDITYGTGTEYGFDFLRDRMKKREAKRNAAIGETGNCVQRGFHFILADEADSLLIDDANTPMILGAQVDVDDTHMHLIRWVVSLAPKAVESQHYIYKLREKCIELTVEGRAWVRGQLSQCPHGSQSSTIMAYELIEKAILVRRDYHRDTQYLVRDKEIVLINEGTGRLGEGRQLQAGIHQIIQAVEGVPITAPNSHAARVTVQGFFLTYRHLAGMSGTAKTAAKEFRRVYKMPVTKIPTAKVSRRRRLAPMYFDSSQKRWDSVCQEIVTVQSQGRAVLVGTRSVEKSEYLSEMLVRMGVRHNVLNARNHAEEAEIISKAGSSGAVTIATGMAGRGTDIKLTPEVEQAGGLHVILTELHDSIRSDAQLFGRCARQGDPGSYRQYLSLEDEILETAFGVKRSQRLRDRLRGSQGNPSRIGKALYAAQEQIEKQHRASRFTQLYQEKRRLRSLLEMGLDPVLDTLS